MPEGRIYRRKLSQKLPGEMHKCETGRPDFPYYINGVVKQKNTKNNRGEKIVTANKIFRSGLIVFLSVNIAVAAASASEKTFQQAGTQERPEAQKYTVAAATSAIKIDGILDEKAWEDAAVIKILYEWMPGDNVPPPVDTDCLVTFDRDNFYIAFRCYDPEPAKIRAHLMDRDAIDTFIQDDHINFMLDTFNDERRAFQFRANPLGVQADANFSESEGYEDFSWDAIWASKGKITEWGWVLEIAIPFNQLRFPRTGDVQTWGFSVGRSYPRNVRHRLTSHRRDRDVTCIQCQFNKITGIQGISPGLNIELDPTLTTIRTDKRENFPAPGAPLEKGKIDPDPGLTARWGITPNLILNAAVNPDFSQVEADVRELEVNTRFAIRYPEKRPFFLEGADFFLTPIEAVFTRTVADPDGGLKFTGKIGKNAFGIFGAYDRVNNLLFPSNQGSSSTAVDQGVGSGVFRYRRDIGRTSNLGVLYTGRVSDDYYNHVAGADGFFQISRTKQFRIQYLHSETKYADNIAGDFAQKTGAIGGDALFMEFMHFGRNWLYLFNYRDFNPDFRADYGYVPRVDMRSGTGAVGYTFWGKRGGWFNQIRLMFTGSAVYDHDSDLTDRSLEIVAQYLGPLQSTVMTQYQRSREFYLTEYYDLDQFVLYAEMKPISGLRFNSIVQFGDAIDYNNARRAIGLNILPFVEFSLGRHINVNLQHAFQRLTLEGDEILAANLSQIKIVYNFNVRTFVRVIVQYLDVARNPDLYLFPIPDKTQTVFSQLLFSYKINPQTVLFIGYSDNYVGMTNIDITQTNRTFFVKLGYAWTK